jgi:hypothetical protein
MHNLQNTMLENCTTQCFFHPDFAAMLNAIWWPSSHALQLKCEEERTAMLWGTQAQCMGGRSKGSWARPSEPQPKREEEMRGRAPLQLCPDAECGQP